MNEAQETVTLKDGRRLGMVPHPAHPSFGLVVGFVEHPGPRNTPTPADHPAFFDTLLSLQQRVRELEGETNPETGLKSCPFCGSDDVDAEFVMCGNGEVAAGCMTCGACGPDESKDAAGATAKWNRRPALPPAARESAKEKE